MTQRYPAPWNLRGNGYIFLYKFSKEYRDHPAFRSPLTDQPFSGFGTVMLVDYHESDAGPYRELLFIPGEYPYLYKKYYSITKIYVSTIESVVNGRENWGIPKELADFSIEKLSARRERITVSKDGIVFFDVILKKRWLNFPVNTKYYSTPLIQKLDDNETVFFTRFKGSGRGRLATMESLVCNDELFPCACSQKPLAVTAIEDFSIEFPVPFKLKKED